MFLQNRLGEPQPQRIAIVRALRGLGDLLCVVPALRALRATLPQAHIALVGLPSVEYFVTRYRHYLDELVEFPGFPGIPERVPDLDQFPIFLAEVHRRHFDLALQMHGSGTYINSFTALLGARYTAGFFLPSLYCPDPDRFLPYPATVPEVERHLRLMEFLGVPRQGDELEFSLQAQDFTDFENLALARDLGPGDYVCIHPGANAPNNRWSPDEFAAVADAHAARGLRVVLTGSRDEAAVTKAVARKMHSRAVNLAGRTSLGALAVLLTRARLLVSNYTGVSHLAAALRVPSVVVFIASDPDRWAPLNHALHRAVGRPPNAIACGHCGDLFERCCLRESCAFLTPEMASVKPERPTVERVIAEAEELLAGVHYAL